MLVMMPKEKYAPKPGNERSLAIISYTKKTHFWINKQPSFQATDQAAAASPTDDDLPVNLIAASPRCETGHVHGLTPYRR